MHVLLQWDELSDISLLEWNGMSWDESLHWCTWTNTCGVHSGKRKKGWEKRKAYKKYSKKSLELQDSLFVSWLTEYFCSDSKDECVEKYQCTESCPHGSCMNQTDCEENSGACLDPDKIILSMQVEKQEKRLKLNVSLFGDLVCSKCIFSDWTINWRCVRHSDSAIQSSIFLFEMLWDCDSQQSLFDCSHHVLMWHRILLGIP